VHAEGRVNLEDMLEIGNWEEKRRSRRSGKERVSVRATAENGAEFGEVSGTQRCEREAFVAAFRGAPEISRKQEKEALSRLALGKNGIAFDVIASLSRTAQEGANAIRAS
jgi:hypothetical protein